MNGNRRKLNNRTGGYLLRKELKKEYKQKKLLKSLVALENTIQSVPNDGEKPSKCNISTLSIAVPSSILENTQSVKLRTYVAGQIARAACIFKVDEIIVFDDVPSNGPTDPKQRKLNTDDSTADEPPVMISRSCLQMARILQYLECPQYLRKFFFPLHQDLKYSGLLNPLDAPHHLRQQNSFIYREGIVTKKPTKNCKGCLVDVGLLKECYVNTVVAPGHRVTVKFNSNNNIQSKKLQGTIVSPSEPKLNTGVYWGYSVRIAKSFSDIFTKSPYDNGYDLTIGTSDKGKSVHNVSKDSLQYDHALIVYGGLQGLELILENDDKLDTVDPSIIFDYYLNTVPGQGSRTIRTEEAVLISLAALENKLIAVNKSKEFSLHNFIAQSNDTGLKQSLNAVDKKQGTKCAKLLAMPNVMDDDFYSRFD